MIPQDAKKWLEENRIFERRARNTLSYAEKAKLEGLCAQYPELRSGSDPSKPDHCSSASDKWHEESNVIKGEAARKTQIIEQILRDHALQGKNKNWPAGKVLLVSVLLIVLCYGLVRYVGIPIWGRAEAEKIIQNPAEAKDSSPETLAAEIPLISETISEQPPAKIKETFRAVQPKPARLETLWMPAPVLPDSIARKGLRVRLILDPSLKGKAQFYVPRDSNWLLIRAHKDSASAYRKTNAYISAEGTLVIQGVGTFQ